MVSVLVSRSKFILASVLVSQLRQEGFYWLIYDCVSVQAAWFSLYVFVNEYKEEVFHSFRSTSYVLQFGFSDVTYRLLDRPTSADLFTRDGLCRDVLIYV